MDSYREYQYASHKFWEEYRRPVKYYHCAIKIERYFSSYLELPIFLKSELFASNAHISSPTYPPKGAFMFVTNKTLHFRKCYTACSDAEVKLLE